MNEPPRAGIESNLRTARLSLTPLTEDDADELFPILKDERLYQFTGDWPPTDLETLRQRYAQLSSRRSPDGTELWFNWVIRLRADAKAIGFVQATVSEEAAEMAWVVGVPWQGRGYAKEAAQRVIERLAEELGAKRITACIRPGHSASESIAASAGLQPSEEIIDGEIVWTLPLMGS